MEREERVIKYSLPKANRQAAGAAAALSTVTTHEQTQTARKTIILTPEYTKFTLDTPRALPPPHTGASHLIERPRRSVRGV